jgi:hypothetical protein|tara:strand:- start:624 stop:752 length:129 start_codon:yes stop_codon:yes gene_type:complete
LSEKKEPAAKEKEQELIRLNAQLEEISKKASNLVKFNKKAVR